MTDAVNPGSPPRTRSNSNPMQTPAKAHQAGLEGVRFELQRKATELGKAQQELERVRETINLLEDVHHLKSAGESAVWQVKAAAIGALAFIALVHLAYARSTYHPPVHH